GRTSRRRRPTRRSRPQPHPFTATFAQLQEALALPDGRAASPAQIVAWLPSTADAPFQSRGAAGPGAPAEGPEIRLAPWKIDTLCLGAAEAVRVLLSLAEPSPSLGVELGDDLQCWTS